MTDANLECVQADCGGEFRYIGTDDETDRFECVQCGKELAQKLPPVLSDWAKALAGGAE